MACAQQAAPAPASSDESVKVSKVRVARLSEVKGDAALDRSTGSGFEAAFSNLPITERSRLQTGMGRAEVEFEDGSTVRLAPFTLVEFSRLQLLPTGGKASTVTVIKGTAYVSLIPSYLVNTKGNDFLLDFGPDKLHLDPSDHIRVELDKAEARVVVLDGSGRIEGPFGSAKLAKKRTFTFNLASPTEPTITKSVQSAPLDKWDQGEAEIHQRNANTARLATNGGKHGAKPASTGMPHDIFR
jgi:hypothetical protein